MTQLLRKPSEWILLAAGLLILVSIPLIASSEEFSLWIAAKVFYLIGVVAILFES